MSIQHTVTRQYKDRSSAAIQLSESVTGNAEYNLDDSAVPVANNHQYNWAITRANLQSVCLYAAAAVTVYTNAPSSGSPQDTIPIAAGQTLTWTLQTDLIAKCPFSGNITALYVTNASGGTVQFSVRCVLNQ
jgi:hypothetical protein